MFSLEIWEGKCWIAFCLIFCDTFGFLDEMREVNVQSLSFFIWHGKEEVSPNVSKVSFLVRSVQIIFTDDDNSSVQDQISRSYFLSFCPNSNH